MRHWTLSKHRTEQSTRLLTCLYLSSSCYTSSKTPGQSVESGKTAGKVFKKGRESPLEATVNELVPRLIRMLVSHWAQKHKKYFCAQSEASISRAAFVIFLYKGFCLLFAVPVWHLRAFSEKRFLRKWGPQNRKNPII